MDLFSNAFLCVEKTPLHMCLGNRFTWKKDSGVRLLKPQDFGNKLMKLNTYDTCSFMRLGNSACRSHRRQTMGFHIRNIKVQYLKKENKKDFLPKSGIDPKPGSPSPLKN